MQYNIYNQCDPLCENQPHDNSIPASSKRHLQKKRLIHHATPSFSRTSLMGHTTIKRWVLQVFKSTGSQTARYVSCSNLH